MSLEYERQIEKYCRMFLKWLNINNISSRNTTLADLQFNIVDSLNGIDFVEKEKSIADIGTGGGLPGVPLAIVLPDVRFLLVEASRKKCSFLRLVKQELDLKNVEIINNRLEKLADFPCVISKAAFSLDKIINLARHVSSKGRLLLWSTPKCEEALKYELSSLGFVLSNKKIYSVNDKARSIFIFTHI